MCPASRSWFLPRPEPLARLGRNIFGDTGFKNVDFSVCKTFKKLVLVFENKREFSKSGTGFSNPVLVSENRRRFSKSCSGFSNPALVSKNQHKILNSCVNPAGSKSFLRDALQMGGLRHLHSRSI